mmetsp:Transcript_30637/g.47015  ORF Transcript_30637/g.47015 Transcript_30637/m.47015 type:complete len:233 (-) Transcript_30637:96-794(-)
MYAGPFPIDIACANLTVSCSSFPAVCSFPFSLCALVLLFRLRRYMFFFFCFSLSFDKFRSRALIVSNVSMMARGSLFEYWKASCCGREYADGSKDEIDFVSDGLFSVFADGAKDEIDFGSDGLFSVFAVELVEGFDDAEDTGRVGIVGRNTSSSSSAGRFMLCFWLPTPAILTAVEDGEEYGRGERRLPRISLSLSLDSGEIRSIISRGRFELSFILFFFIKNFCSVIASSC